MEWVEILTAVGITSLGQILLIGAMILFGKKLIEYFFKESIEIRKIELAQALELHKQKIDQENTTHKLEIDKNFETYRNKLEILKLEYQVQFAKLHDERSRVIELLYEKLVRLNFAMLDLSSGHWVKEDAEKEEQMRLNEANEAYFEFYKYYGTKKIFFQPEVCKILENLKTMYWDKAMDLTEVRRMRAFGLKGAELAQSFQKAIDAGKAIKVEIPKGLELLENEFRILLGVTSSGSPESK